MHRPLSYNQIERQPTRQLSYITAVSWGWSSSWAVRWDLHVPAHCPEQESTTSNPLKIGTTYCNGTSCRSFRICIFSVWLQQRTAYINAKDGYILPCQSSYRGEMGLPFCNKAQYIPNVQVQLHFGGCSFHPYQFWCYNQIPLSLTLWNKAAKGTPLLHV